MKKALLMGILNVTPDSFSDGGRFANSDDAIGAGLRMVADGADIIDVGGESTRPGAEDVPVEEELRRVVPVVAGLADRGARVSVDTSKAAVAKAALLAGAQIVNDVTALNEPEMAEICAASGCTVCLMHMKGNPRTMQKEPEYANVTMEVLGFLIQRCRHAEAAGIRYNRIWIDPGIGFGKTLEHNLELLRNIETFTTTDYPVLLGVSRKSMIARLTGGASVDDRLEGTLALQAYAQTKGVSVIRAHDVKEARRAIDVLAAISR
jgi:dihydropteroate synthase